MTWLDLDTNEATLELAPARPPVELARPGRRLDWPHQAVDLG
ncbi:hypothetical protein [Amycolatopsis albispora]|nr:hypothetical protein [Amycolatopsis albispora]